MGEIEGTMTDAKLHVPCLYRRDHGLQGLKLAFQARRCPSRAPQVLRAA